MGQQQGGVYDPASGKVITIDEARAKVGGGGQLGFEVGNQSFGVDLPPVPGDDANDMLSAFPQLAGILASLTPQGRTLKGAAGVPAILDAVIQAITKGVGNVDPVQSGAQAAMGLVGHGVGKGVGAVGNMGESKILRSLNLTGDMVNDASIKALPKMAIKEGARLTEASEAAIRNKAKNTASGGLEELADAMGQSRRSAAVAPSRTTFWPNEMAANYLREPSRQMAMGQNMVKPLGLAGTREVLAPTAETGVRALLALLASQMGGGESEEPALETSRGPRRRGQ